jgi:hypothetical protein
MSTVPQESPETLAQILAGAQIQSTYADTGNGTGADVGAYPRAVASGAHDASGAITTFTVQLAVKYRGNAAPIAILSAKPGSSTLATEHTYTGAGDWCLLTSNHAGGVLYVQVKGDIDGTGGDTFTAYVRGVSP